MDPRMIVALMQDLHCYKRFRHAVFEGALLVVKDEMINFLFKLYVYVLYKSIHTKVALVTYVVVGRTGQRTTQLQVGFRGQSDSGS